VLSVFQAIMRWLICAPRGTPVVPPVKISAAMSSSLTDSVVTGTAGAACKVDSKWRLPGSPSPSMCNV